MTSSAREPSPAELREAEEQQRGPGESGQQHKQTETKRPHDQQREQPAGDGPRRRTDHGVRERGLLRPRGHSPAQNRDGVSLRPAHPGGDRHRAANLGVEM